MVFKSGTFHLNKYDMREYILEGRDLLLAKLFLKEKKAKRKRKPTLHQHMVFIPLMEWAS